MPMIPQALQVPLRSAAAERMRRHRQRQRDGVRCVTIELNNFEIYDLISLGLLKYETRNDVDAIKDALHGLLDQAVACDAQRSSTTCEFCVTRNDDGL